MKFKKPHLGLTVGVIVLLLLTVVTVTWTSFTAQSQITGSSFSTGRPDLFLLRSPGLPPTSDNLAHDLPGLQFHNIMSNWSDVQGLKLYNQGTVRLDISLQSTLLTELSTDSALSQKLLVRVAEWHDGNEDGGVQLWEVGTPLAEWQTLEQWETQAINLGVLYPEEVLPIVLTFKINEIDNTYADKTAAYDFIFDAQGAN